MSGAYDDVLKTLVKDNWFIKEITEEAVQEAEKRVREEDRRKLEEE